MTTPLSKAIAAVRSHARQHTGSQSDRRDDELALCDEAERAYEALDVQRQEANAYAVESDALRQRAEKAEGMSALKGAWIDRHSCPDHSAKEPPGQCQMCRAEKAEAGAEALIAVSHRHTKMILDLGQVCAQLRRAREVIAEKDQYIEWALDMLPDAEYSDDTEEAHEMPTYYLNRALKLKLDAPEDSK